MLDIKCIRENTEFVKQRLATRGTDYSALVDKAVALDAARRALIADNEEQKARQNAKNKEIPALKKAGQDVSAVFEELKEIARRIKEDDARQAELEKELEDVLLAIPNLPNERVPVGRDDSENVEIERFGEPFVPEFEVPYHVDIMERLNGIDLDAARKTSGNGFYYLKGDIARLHSACLSYARDFMIDRGFTYYIPPYMIRSSVVTGVMSFAEMENMMYKIEGEDLYLIGTSEHSMIGKFIDQIIPEEKLPYISILQSVLGIIDTKNYEYSELFNEINVHTGGIGTSLELYPNVEKVKEKEFKATFEIKTKALYGKLPVAFCMMQEILTESQLTDEKRLKEILSMTKTRLQDRFLSAGHSAAALRAMSYKSPISKFKDTTNGIEYYQNIREMEEHFDEKKEEIIIHQSYLEDNSKEFL